MRLTHPARTTPTVARRRWSEESGTSLLMVLAFLIVFSTVIAALLGIIITSNRAVATYRQDRAMRYAADGALEVAVVNVQGDMTLGDTGTDEPCATLPLDGSPSGTSSGMPDVEQVFTAGSELVVRCRLTDPATASGDRRDITFTVWCGRSGGGPGGRVTCNPGGGDERLVAEARVRYDLDPGHPVEAERARVPKIVSWVLHR